MVKWYYLKTRATREKSRVHTAVSYQNLVKVQSLRGRSFIRLDDHLVN